MDYAVEQIARQIQAARQGKGLSQRELSALSGISQGRISRIEAGDLDLRLSSLTALASALDLELVLAPRKAMPAIRSLSASALRQGGGDIVEIRRAFEQLSETLRGLQIREPELIGLDELRRGLGELQRLPDSSMEVSELRKLRALIEQIGDPARARRALPHSLDLMREIRNRKTHGRPGDNASPEPRPAWSLDETDD